MNNKILVAAMMALLFIPLSGCKIRKSFKQEKQVNATLKRQNDSLSISYKSVVLQLATVKKEDSAGFNSLDKLREYSEAHNVLVESEVVVKPVVVTGETYKTSFTADWTLDSAEVQNGKLVYYDVDNPTFRATIYKDSATKAMMVEIRTKDKIIDVPVQKIKFQSNTAIQQRDSLASKNSSLISKSDAAALAYADSSNNLIAGSYMDSATVGAFEKTDSNLFSKGFSGWQWIIISIVGVAGIVVLIFLKFK